MIAALWSCHKFSNNISLCSLQWVTKNKKNPSVYYGTTSGSYDYVSKAASISYNATDMCGSPATDWGWRDPGLLHTVYMEG